MKVQVVNATILTVFLSACSHPNREVSVDDTARKEIESAVINRFHAMIKYAEAGDIENVLAHFAPDGPGSYIDNGTRYSSFQEMAVNYRATWKVQRQDYGVPVTRLYVLSPTRVLLISSSTLSTTNRDGVSFQPRPWAMTTLWVLQEDEWFIHSFHQHEGDLKPVVVNEGQKK